MKTPDQSITENAKIAAIVSYLTPIGLIISFFINLEEKHPFANFHIRQSLGIQTLFYAIGALLGVVPQKFALVAGIGFFVCFFIMWIVGIVTALKKVTNPIPVIGILFQKVFQFIK